MSKVTTQAGVDELKKLAGEATQDEVKTALGELINDGEAAVADAQKSLVKEAEEFFLNLGDHIKEESRELYNRVKPFL